MFKKLPNSTRKFIRLEKARIRRDVLDSRKQEEMVKEIYNKFFNKQPAQENIKKPEVKKKEKPNQKGTSSSQARAKIQKSKKEKSKIEKIKTNKKKKQ